MRKTWALASATGAGLLLLSACGGGGGTPSGGGTAQLAGQTGKVSVGSTDAGKVLVDPHGMTMYAFAADSPGHSTCNGACASYWPPVKAAEAAKGATSSVTATLGTTKRADGSSQLTVNKYPMYTYAGDTAPGQANGQGKNLSGGLWWVVSPSGAWVKQPAAPASSSGGGHGY